MSMGWRNCKLGDVLTLQRGFDLPASARREGSVPVVSSSGITGFHDEAKVRGPGVVIGRYGTLGEVHFVSGDYWPLNTSLYVKDFKGHDRRYCAYLLKTVGITTTSTAAAVPGVNRNVLHQLPVRLPDLHTQERIASILGAYDDLIEVNRRRIALLEEMAWRWFEEWFIHERPPGDAVFAPTLLGEVAEVEWGDTKTTKKSYVSKGYLAYSASGPDGFLDHFDHEGPGIVLSAIGARCGKIWLADGQWSCIKNTIVIKARNNKTTTCILYLLLNRPDVWLKRGAAQPFISQGDARKMALSLPPLSVQNIFDKLVAPILNQCRTLDMANNVLARSRDLLLPRLISGEMHVTTAERELEAVA